MAERDRRAPSGRLDQPRETRRALLPRPTMNQETFGGGASGSPGSWARRGS